MRTPFDEQAALEELERLRMAVEDSRKRRKDASEAFDAFVSSFRKEPTAPAPPPPRSEMGALSRAYEVSMASAGRPAASRTPLPKASVVAGAVLVIAAGVMLTRAWRTSPAQAPDASAVSASAPAATVPEPASPAEAPSRVTPIPGMLQAELRAIRRVWLRATADGARVVERELQADERVPLPGARTLVIRAGDAGAVRVAIDGRDRGPLGEDGVVLTRTFSATPPGGR